MEDGTGARAFLAKAAATFTVLSLLPVALSGSAPSHASPALRIISASDSSSAFVGDVPWPTSLFAAFTYDRGQVLGTYVQFGYDATSGTIESVLGLGGAAPVQFIASMTIEGFPPSRWAAARGPIFEAEGYLVNITAHDDPTGLLEIRSDVDRVVTIELPAEASNISLLSVPGSWRASSVAYTVQGEEGRLLLGAGSLNVTGTRVTARMASPDLLLFKAVPPAFANKAEWRLLLDAIGAGQVVAELDLVATSDGQWVHNTARYRLDVAAWPLEVKRGRASVQVDSLLPGGAVVLLAFDPDTMPSDEPSRLSVQANGGELNRSDNTLTLFYTPPTNTMNASYALLPLTGTVIAVYLPSLAAISIDVVSVPPPPPRPAFDPGSEAAMIAALAIVSVAAAHILRRRED